MAEPEPAPAPPASLSELLAASAPQPTEEQAWAGLFSLWNARFDAASGPPCAQSLRQGLECLEADGGTTALRRFNRPAVVVLQDDSGVPHHAVLTQLREDTAQLTLGGLAHDVPLAELEQRWNGAFMLLWKPAQLDTRNLSVGTAGAPVLNLRRQLNRWAGLGDPPVDAPEYFDEQLEDLVIRFQAGNGLVVDGIAGVRTQALLDAAVAAPGSPLLSAAVH